MLRPVHLVLLLLMVVLVAASEESPSESERADAKPFLSNDNDLEADASYWGYSRPWRYGGWRGGWGGWRGGGGWGWGGRAWIGRGGWW